MKSRLLLWVSVLMWWGCDFQHRAGEKDIPPIETPPSYLGVRITFPGEELQAGVNRVLPMTLFDGGVPLEEAPDTLFLKIVRQGDLKLDIREQRIYASIPLEITVAVKKKVMGITFSNQQTPISFKGTMNASAEVAITEDWELDAICHFEKFDLGETPKINVMGLSINLEKPITKALKSHEDDISNVICTALNSAIHFRSTIDELWKDLQQPLLVAGKPHPLWMYSEPIVLNGELQPLRNNELAIHLEYRTHLRLTTEKHSVSKIIELSSRGEPLNNQPTLVAYPDVLLPYQLLTEQLKTRIAGMAFDYEAYHLEITDAEVGRDGQRIRVRLSAKGDFNGDLIVLGRPVISEDKILTLEDFSYEVASDNDLVNLTDQAVHYLVEQYITTQLEIDLQPFLSKFDQVISHGIAQSSVGTKMDLDITFNDISSYKIRLTDDAIQWIFFADGVASLTLKRGLFGTKN